MAQRRTGRGLSSEELELWRRVTSTVRAAPGMAKMPEPQDQARPVKKQIRPAPPQPPVPKLKPDPISAAQLDGKLDSRLKRGRLEPERTLDLHGLTAARAEAILKIFIAQSRTEGVRLVLVITGKGRSAPDTDDFMPTRKGILRDHLPVWVHALGDAVVKTVPAHQRHGGSGAFYLYLRRKRPGGR